MHRDDAAPDPLTRDWVTAHLARLEGFAPTDPRRDPHQIEFWRKWLESTPADAPAARP